MKDLNSVQQQLRGLRHHATTLLSQVDAIERSLTPNQTQFFSGGNGTGRRSRKRGQGQGDWGKGGQGYGPKNIGDVIRTSVQEGVSQGVQAALTAVGYDPNK